MWGGISVPALVPCGCVALVKGDTACLGLSVFQLYSKGCKAMCSWLLLVLSVQEPVLFRMGEATCQPWTVPSGGEDPLTR